MFRGFATVCFAVRKVPPPPHAGKGHSMWCGTKLNNKKKMVVGFPI